MAFRDNSTLISSAQKVDMIANGTSDSYNAAGGAFAFVVADGSIGDDTISGFGNDDTIINGKKIFDGNGDGYISFGANSVLDVDRTSSRNAGEDSISVLGSGNDRVLEVRYLGGKDGGFAYADSSTRDDLLGRFTKGFDSSAGFKGGDSSITQALRIDNDVSDNTYNFGGAGNSVALLTDNKLGLNFGGDTINGFGGDDLLIFTSKIYDSNGNNKINFGGNLVLDLSGAGGPSSTDPEQGPGGQIDINNPNKTTVYYLGEKTVGDSTYYYYGTQNAGTFQNLASHGVHMDSGF